MSNLKKKAVPSAETKTQENGEKAADVAQTASGPEPASVSNSAKPQEQESAKPSGPAFVSIDSVLAKVDTGMLQKAEALGIPIGQLLLWAKSVDQKFDFVGNALQQIGKKVDGIPTDESIANSFMAKLKAEREKAIAQQQTAYENQPQPEQRSQGMGSDMMILREILGGAGVTGGGANPISEKMTKLQDAILDKAIDGVVNPKASKFEQLFEEELAKAKAKTMARVLTEG